MEMSVLDFILAVATLVSGGGWWVSRQSYLRDMNGKATQSEAQGWEAMQNVYQQAIKDLRDSIEDIRSDRNRIRDKYNKLQGERDTLIEEINKLKNEVSQLRDEVTDNKKKLEAMENLSCASAFSCEKHQKIKTTKN